MKNISYRELSEEDQSLLDEAEKALENAYNPYRSQFKVGASVLTEGGAVFKGSCYGAASSLANLCAERAAVVVASSSGEKSIKKLALVSSGEEPCMPCGLCRQFLAELPKLSGVDLEILSANSDKTKVVQTSLSEIFPHPYA